MSHAEHLADDCPCDDPRDVEIKRLKQKLSKRKPKVPPKRKRGRGKQLFTEAERYEQSHQVRTSVVTIQPNSVMPGVTANRYRVLVVFQRVDTGPGLTIIRVHASQTDPTKAGAPTSFVGSLYAMPASVVANGHGLPLTWPTPGCCCWKAIYSGNLCLVNTDLNNAQVVSVTEVVDSFGGNES